MTAVTGQASGQMWLAGNQGPSLSPAVWWLVVTVLALAFGASALVASARRRREEPLRNEIQAQPVTFRSAVDVKANVLGTMTAQRGPLNLVVHGDLFQVLHPFPVARFLFGQDYCYRAQDATVEMIPGALHDWIEISGQPAQSAARIWIGRRKLNRQLWDVLVSAGAHPIGSPPAQLAALAVLDAPGSGLYGRLASDLTDIHNLTATLHTADVHAGPAARRIGSAHWADPFPSEHDACGHCACGPSENVPASCGNGGSVPSQTFLTSTPQKAVTALAARFDSLPGESYRVSESQARIERMTDVWARGVKAATAGRTAETA